jgi:hypothetical protein
MKYFKIIIILVFLASFSLYSDAHEEDHTEHVVECSQLSCGDLNCPNGLQKDENGCEICKCACPLKCSFYKTRCKNGLQKDKYGCDICKCCPNLGCPLKCRNGTLKIKDKNNGCEICICNPKTN